MMLTAASRPAWSEPVELTLEQAEAVLNGLATLSAGHEVITREGEKDKVTRVQYKGWSLGLIMAMTKNINALKPPVLDYGKARTARMRDLGDAEGKLSPAQQKAFEQEDAAKRAEKSSYDLARFKVSELKPDTNEISPAILSLLQPILTAE